MKESYGEGPASHTGPESCMGDREVVYEALTGGHAGRVSSHESYKSGMPTLSTEAEGNSRAVFKAMDPTASRGVEDPWHAWTHLTRKPGDPRADPSRQGGSASKTPRGRQRR